MQLFCVACNLLRIFFIIGHNCIVSPPHARFFSSIIYFKPIKMIEYACSLKKRLKFVRDLKDITFFLLHSPSSGFENLLFIYIQKYLLQQVAPLFDCFSYHAIFYAHATQQFAWKNRVACTFLEVFYRVAHYGPRCNFFQVYVTQHVALHEPERNCIVAP